MSAALAALACARPTKKHPDGRTGTTAGYLAHLKASEDACEPCKAAMASKSAVRRGYEDYGTYRQALARYRGQVRAGEPVPVCAQPTRRRPDGRTGTRAGYLAHYYAGESACDACLAGSARQAAQDRVDDPERALRGNLYGKYRLSLETYDAMLTAQGGKCAICGADSPGDVRIGRFHVDHDHACCPGDKTCGKCVRGLLCRACNTALGNFGDDPDRLLAALSYLLSHGKEVAC